MSSADLEKKMRITANPKKRRSIHRVLFNRWNNSIGRLHLGTGEKLQRINFGEMP